MLITRARFARTGVTKMVTSVCGYEVKQQNAITNVTHVEKTEEIHSSVCKPSSCSEDVVVAPQNVRLIQRSQIFLYKIMFWDRSKC